MNSDSLFIKCESCGTINNKNLNFCSKCGCKLKRSRGKIYFSIGLLAFFLLLFISSYDNHSKESSGSVSSVAQKLSIPEPPEAEIRLISLSEMIRDKYGSVKNELQKSVLRDERKIQLGNIGLTKATNWIGTISKLDTNTDGNGILVIKLSPNLTLATWNNTFSDMQDDTLIDKGSELYNALLNMSVGQKVMFSGAFFPSSQDTVKEKSITINGSLSEPEFLFRFNSIKSI
ncbi:hypothetical protein ACMV8I_03315 [Ewingella sp. S1.OA.A_B6]